MKKTLVILFALFIGSCGTAVSTENTTFRGSLSTAQGTSPRSVTTETPTPTASPNAVETARMVIAFDGATSTAAAAATSTSSAVTTTAESKATDAFWGGVTLQVATERATETQIAKTEKAGTEHAAAETSIPLTQTPLAITQQAQIDQAVADRVSLWIYRVGFALFIVAILGVLVYALIKGLPIAEEAGNAKVMAMKTGALKPDEHGRRPAVPTSVLKKGEKLLIPELAHRGAMSQDEDDLTSIQALANTGDQRKLEAVRSIAESPIMPRLLGKMADSFVKQVLPQAQPDGAPGATPLSAQSQPLLASPDGLAQPHFKTLFAWDGKFLPYGVDADNQLMLVDPTRRPHMMVAGESGSGKTRSVIRTLVAGALTSGWNVVVLGKRVDFLPFEEHPNCIVLAVDVRKEADKYIQILRSLTAQMDVRDGILSSRNVSTWDRYGAPQTMVVLDDYSGAMWRMSRSDRAEVLNEAKQIAMDGRKFGLNLVIGLQRASWTSIDTDLRSQMGRVVFRVSSSGESRMALDVDGAERLPFLNFLSRLSDDAQIRQGVGFFLEDNQTEAFLRSRPVQENGGQEWILDTTAKDVEAPAEEEPAVETDESKIKQMYLDYVNRRERPSLRAIETAVFGRSGGSYHNAVKAAIADLEGCQPEEVAGVINQHVEGWGATTQGATTGDSAGFGALPA